MFLYNNNIKDSKLFITIPPQIQYNFKFLNSITELMEKIDNSGCREVYFSCKSDMFDFSKMSIAYLNNVMHYFLKQKNVYANRELYNEMRNSVLHTQGKKFQRIDIKDFSKQDCLQCYYFDNDKDVFKSVRILVEFIAKYNLILCDAQEFLITTIGEIFSNAFNHSEENLLYFIYDIEKTEDKCFLVINITDFGKTIVSNVKDYQRKFYEKDLNDNQCIEWAIKSGNTTRDGSGGYGLPTLIDCVKSIKGELLVFSGCSMYALKGTKENILLSKGKFYGTSISMKIPLFDSKVILYDEDTKKLIRIDLNEI